MKVIIAWSRDIHDYALLMRAIAASGFQITEVVSGTQLGVDKMGERWAKESGLPCHREPPASHDYQGLRGRNAKMAAYADAAIVIPAPSRAGRGNGSLDIIKRMEAYGKPVFVPELEG